MQPDIIPIKMDEDGALPEEISKACEELLKRGKPLPKVHTYSYLTLSRILQSIIL